MEEAISVDGLKSLCLKMKSSKLFFYLLKITKTIGDVAAGSLVKDTFFFIKPKIHSFKFLFEYFKEYPL